MNILPYVPLIVKAFLGKNVKEEMDNRIDVINRPFLLSGRFIGAAVVALCGTGVVGAGYDVTMLTGAITELANLVYDKWGLLTVVGGMLYGIGRGLLGIIQRKK